MELGSLLLGRRIVLQSPLPAVEVVRRIRAKRGFLFNPFYSGVTGWNFCGYFGVRWSAPLHSNGFHPVLVFKLVDNLGATEIRARFGPNPIGKAFLVFWYAFVTLTCVAIVSSLDSSGNGTGSAGVFGIILLLFLLLPVLLLYLGNRYADAELELILDFLAEEAQATVQPS